MATDISKDTLDKETDGRFWAQTGYKPGQKLDPNNQTDKAYVPVWKDIFRKVQREADAGTLVTTFDHPLVAQPLADATVANKAAAAHLDAAVASNDPATSHENVRAATVATQIAVQKTREAAANQPSVVSPALVKEAGKEAIKTPPPPGAPSSEHIAHAHARVHAHGHHTPVWEQPLPTTMPAGGPSIEALYKETNTRFWRQTGYKPGQKLDQTIARDREMVKIWRALFQQVQHEAAAGTLMLSSPEQTSSPMPMPMPIPPWGARPPMAPLYPQVPPYQAYPQMPYPQMQPSYQPYPHMQQPYLPREVRSPNGHERGNRHKQGHGRGQHPSMGPMSPQPAVQPGGQPPPMDASSPQGWSGAPPPGAPSPGGFPSPEGAPSTNMPGAPASPDTSPMTPEPSSLGKYLAIGLAIVAGGGLLYYATSHKAPGRTPKVLLASPTRAAPMSALPRP